MNQETIDRNYTYHVADSRDATFKAIRATAKTFAELINTECPDGREKSLALTKVEEAVMWANAAVARECDD